MYKVALVDYDDDLFDIPPQTRTDMINTLAAAGATLNVAQCRSEQTVLEMARDADVVMIQSVRPLLNANVISQLPKCRGIIRLGLGYDSVDVAAATEMGIPVSNVVDWCTDEVAEHAIAHLFACARCLTPLHRGVREGRWERTVAAPAVRIRGKTLGLIGFGRTARAVAQRMKSFGLTVLAYDPFQNVETIARCDAHKVELDDLLCRADFISLHVPLTPETHHLLGAREFGLMKKGVCIINTSRGAVIDEAALIAALRSGRVRGTGLDVMEQEPLPGGSPLREFDNVTLTPHVASYSLEAVETLYRFGAQIAADLLSNKRLPTIVNPQARAIRHAPEG